jgi:hypothetical protein
MRWLPFFRRGSPPAPPAVMAMPDVPDSDQPLTGAVLSSGPESGLDAGSGSSQDGKEPAGFNLYLELLGEKSVPLVLIAVGIGIVAADDSIEVNQVTGWGNPEYVGMLAFAALLIVLGCVERIVQLRSARAPLVERPRHTGNGRSRVRRRLPPDLWE